jgi:hypothetical protein
MTRPLDKGTTAAAEAAERAQAEYYRCVLAERRAEIDLAIVKLLTAIPRHAAQAAASDLGGLVRDAERERKDIDRMIDALDRRFPRAELTPLRTPPPDEIIHPDGRSLLSIGQKRRAANEAAGLLDHERVS